MTKKALAEELAALRSENEALKRKADIHLEAVRREASLRKRLSRENECLKYEVETLRAAANGSGLQEAFIQATIKAGIDIAAKSLREIAVKEFAHFLIDKAYGGTISVSDLPDLVCEMLSKYPEDIPTAKNEP